MSRQDVEAVASIIGALPDAGDIIQGTGGCRKLRFGGRGKGKSGGYRIITFFTGPTLPVFLLTVFGKGEKSDLTKGERNALAAMTAALVRDYVSSPMRPGDRR